LIFSPEATRYCLPPVFMTAYMEDLSNGGVPRTDFRGAEDYSPVCGH
jgi:hypothetical protein